MDQELYQIIHQAKRGDQRSFAELVTRYKSQVFRHAYAMVNDHMEAEDISQEAFVKAFYSLPKLGNEYAFVSWMTRIVSNLCYDHMQKAKKNSSVAQSEDILENRKSTMDNTELKLTIREALQTLSPQHRTALTLRDIQGFSYDEMTDILHIPLGTVKSRIRAARLELKKELSRGEENG